MSDPVPLPVTQATDAAPAESPLAATVTIPAARAPSSVRGSQALAVPGVADQARIEAPVATALLPATNGFAPESRELAQDAGRFNLTGYDTRNIQLASFNPQAGEFAVTGFARIDPSLKSITLDQLQQSLRSGAFIDELNRLRKQMHEEFDIDRTASVTVAGLSLGVSVLYVLWLVRGGVLVGSYLSALPAWRLLDPLPVLARTGDDGEEDDDEAFEPTADRSPDPLRGFA